MPAVLLDIQVFPEAASDDAAKGGGDSFHYGKLTTDWSDQIPWNSQSRLDAPSCPIIPVQTAIRLHTGDRNEWFSNIRRREGIASGKPPRRDRHGGRDGPDPERAGTEWPFTTHRQARLPELPHPGRRSRLYP